MGYKGEGREERKSEKKTEEEICRCGTEEKDEREKDWVEIVDPWRMDRVQGA